MPAPNAILPTMTADPNLYAAHMLVALETFGASSDTHLEILKRDWHAFRQFVVWVGNGDDDRSWNAELARKRQIEEKAASVARADKVAEDARQRELQESYGSKA